MHLASRRWRSKTRVLGRKARRRGCDLGHYVVKHQHSKRKHCDCFLLFQFRGFPWGQGLPSGPLCRENAAFFVCIVKPTEFANPLSPKRALSDLQNWRVQGNPPTLDQPFANPVPTLRQPFANLSPTFSANPSPSSPSFRGPRCAFRNTG